MVSVVWAGGVIGGRVTIFVSSSLQALGPAVKILRYACNLNVAAGATLTWEQGNIALADGASITIQGIFNVNNFGYGLVNIGKY